MSFSDDRLGDLGQAAGAALLEQQREEVDLEQHVAQLVEELRVVTGRGRVGELVRLLDRVGDDRALVLLAVPRALAAQAAGDLVEPQERLGGCAGHADGRISRRTAAAPVRRPMAAARRFSLASDSSTPSG